MPDPRKVDTCGRLAAIILIVAFGGLVYYQTVRPLLAARRDLGAFQEAVQILSDAEGSVERLNSQIQMVAREIQASEALLPKDLDIDAFLHQLGDFAAQNEVHVEEFKPHAVLERRLYRELPMEIRLNGAFLAIHGFMVQLEQASRLSRVESLTIDQNASRKTCEARIRLALFFAREETS